MHKMTDANESVDETVLTPKINPNATGIEEHMAKVEQTQQEAVQEQTTEEPVDSSPTSESEHEVKSNGVQQRINDITAKRYQEQRRADELQAKLDALEAQKPAQPVQTENLVAPSLPEDIYDEDAMKKYHGDMVEFSRKSAETAATSIYERQQQQGQEQAQQVKQKEVLDKYTTNALRDGVDLDKLRVAEQTINQSGISPELGAFIMNDPNGAKIATYLADNPSEMYEIVGMDPVSAGIQIANQIKPKVLSQTPKVSNAPDPIPEVTGGGFVEKDDFDKTYPGYEIL